VQHHVYTTAAVLLPVLASPYNCRLVWSSTWPMTTGPRLVKGGGGA
jgi:hypothetical protein